jgi:hypothetical protein
VSVVNFNKILPGILGGNLDEKLGTPNGLE